MPETFAKRRYTLLFPLTLQDLCAILYNQPRTGLTQKPLNKKDYQAMRKYVVPIVDPEDQDLADLFCRRAHPTSDPDNMRIDRKPWSLAREIAKRAGLCIKVTPYDRFHIVRHDQTGPMDYRRCTISAVPQRDKHPRWVDPQDMDLMKEARRIQYQHLNPDNWLARKILARKLGLDRLEARQRHVWINEDQRDFRRENLKIVEL
jgi:hypothetical protein